jgi:hypothetical protein
MGFFSSIFKGIGKAIGAVGRFFGIGKAKPNPIANTVATVGATALGNKLSGAKPAGIPTPDKVDYDEVAEGNKKIFDTLYPGTTPQERLGQGAQTGPASAVINAKAQRDLQQAQIRNQQYLADKQNMASIIQSKDPEQIQSALAAYKSGGIFSMRAESQLSIARDRLLDDIRKTDADAAVITREFYQQYDDMNNKGNLEEQDSLLFEYTQEIAESKLSQEQTKNVYMQIKEAISGDLREAMSKAGKSAKELVGTVYDAGSAVGKMVQYKKRQLKYVEGKINSLGRKSRNTSRGTHRYHYNSYKPRQLELTR